MHGENGTPQTPDWQPNAGNLCGTCLGTANLCYVLRAVDGDPCCAGCSHNDRLMNEPTVQLWDGDQV